MGNRSAGPGTPVNLEQRVRWQPAVNVSSYDAPPFAAMVRDHGTASGAANDDTRGGDVVDGQFVWRVGRPDAACALRQRAADIVFNGPEVMLAGKPGRVTEDFPARALHLKEDTLHWKPNVPTSLAGRFAGPKADSWLLWDSGFAFRWLGADTTFQDDKFDAGFVTPAPNPPFIGGIFQAIPNQAPAATEALGQNPLYPWYPLQNTAYGGIPYSDSLQVSSGGAAATSGIKFTVGGIYEFHFNCTVTSDLAQGSVLMIEAFLDDVFLTYGYRVTQIEIDNYGNEIQISSENVAFSGLLLATAGQVLNFRNASPGQIFCSAAYVTVKRNL